MPNTRKFCEHCDAWFDLPATGKSNRHWRAKLDSRRGTYRYVCILAERKRREESQRERKYSLNYYLTEMLRHANQRGVRFNREVTVTVDDLLRMWDEQGGCCAYTGLPMTYLRGMENRPTNASLDRVDSSRGYTPDNVALVQCRVNEMKWNNPLSSVIEIAEMIVARRGLLAERYINEA